MSTEKIRGQFVKPGYTRNTTSQPKAQHGYSCIQPNSLRSRLVLSKCWPRLRSAPGSVITHCSFIIFLFRHLSLTGETLWPTTRPGYWHRYGVHVSPRQTQLTKSQHNTVMGSSIDEPLRVNHQTLNTVIFIENRFLILRTILHSVRRAFETIHKANDALSDADILPHCERTGTSQLFANYINQADAYTQNVSFLYTRAGRTAQLIADTLSFKNALTAQDQSRYMLSLTSSTVEDSTTVRTITIVTLIFLPSTFVAVSSISNNQ